MVGAGDSNTDGFDRIKLRGYFGIRFEQFKFKTRGETGAPILTRAKAFVECTLVDTVEQGDHSLFVGEVVHAGLSVEPTGRPDDETLILKDLGEKTFCGG